MTPPKSIRYHGRLYVRASTTHERCKPDMQTGELNHWNDKQQKCMKLPRKLSLQLTAAHTASGEAHRASRSANPINHSGGAVTSEQQQQLHTRAILAHSRAAAAHQSVALDLHDQGFREKAIEHRKLEHQHLESADTHRDGKHPMV